MGRQRAFVARIFYIAPKNLSEPNIKIPVRTPVVISYPPDRRGYVKILEWRDSDSDQYRNVMQPSRVFRKVNLVSFLSSVIYDDPNVLDIYYK
jgi:hypothetical protein